MLLVIDWNANPEIINLFGFSLRWYGLMFACAFLAGFQVVSYIFKKEGRPAEQADQLLMYAMVATVIGARAGHYFFYEYPSLMADPLDFFYKMIKPPYAGLASHGGAIGLFTAFYLYTRKHKDQKFLYITDRVVPAVALAGFFIRLGNLMNSEIIGKPTDVAWAFRFPENPEYRQRALDLIYQAPRHPSQLYESLSCFILFLLLMWLWSLKKENTRHGLLTGIFMIILFTLRFLYEFLKENQSDFENSMSLNMGQWLSIPGVLFGIIVLFIAFKNKKDIES
ncbi:MAG: prolipoprotein diacylglyceryl transferase [Pseudarcicella sp.]|nr:prolipoprotein diacylglyceryl transferase [Pseudarcicella sp.]MBP6410832.1 prolipoprotein diacylglyceryl transferase [Pseudarcicella sp.]